MHLAEIPSPEGSAVSQGHHLHHHRLKVTNKQYDADDIRRQHDDEHGNVGLHVRLCMEDLEKLDLILQPPAGGGVDEPPLKLGEYLWKSLYDEPPPPTASILLGDVEREIRQHLELELVMSGEEEGKESSDEGGGEHGPNSAANAMARLSLKDKNNDSSTATNTEGSDCLDESENKQDEKDPAHQHPTNQYQKELTYARLRGTTILLQPSPPENVSSGASVSSADAPPPFVVHSNNGSRLHDLNISSCSDSHFYLLQPFEYVTISGIQNSTIVVGAVAGLLHVVDCEKTTITAAARRILVSNSCDVLLNVFTPSPPLLVGDNRTCQFAPYNTYYDGLREDLLATGLAALSEGQSPYHAKILENDSGWPPLNCASNKWKQPVDVSKLEVPQVPGSPVGSPANNLHTPLSPGADDRAMGTSGNDATMQAPVLLPPSDFQILFVPLESESAKLRRLEGHDEGVEGTNSDENKEGDASSGHAATPVESRYYRMLAEILQLSPFRLPVEYERWVLLKAERMKNIQQAVQNNLSPEQQSRFEEELNRGFRDWLVTSGNLRQVLDLVHLEVKGGL
jgi:Tubulin binding cofactor C